MSFDDEGATQYIPRCTTLVYSIQCIRVYTVPACKKCTCIFGKKIVENQIARRICQLELYTIIHYKHGGKTIQYHYIYIVGKHNRRGLHWESPPREDARLARCGDVVACCGADVHAVHHARNGRLLRGQHLRPELRLLPCCPHRPRDVCPAQGPVGLHMWRLQCMADAQRARAAARTHLVPVARRAVRRLDYCLGPIC